jgi:tetratricopeptide (TPR) repeat protein
MDFSMQSKKKLAQLFKKTGRLSEAIQIWQELAAYTPAVFYAVSELAKWLEHHVRDYSRAKILIDKALNQDNIFSEEEKKSLLHRLKRLNSKRAAT